MQRRAHRLLALALALSSTAHAQTLDTTGDEFIVAFLPNLAAGLPAIEVQLTSSVATSVTVEYPVLAPTFVTSVGVTPGSTTVVTIPNTASSAWVADSVMNNAVRLSAAQPFSAELVNRKGATSDGALGLPVATLGLEYYAADYDPPPSNPGGQLAIVATVDGTTVTITPSVPLIGPHAAGVAFNVSLDRGEAYFGMTAVGSSVGLSGTHVVADQPVSVSNGAYCLNVPTSITACDHIFEVAMPVDTWRDSYLAANLPVRPAGSIYRIFAGTNGTAVTMDGVPVTGSPIDAGEFLEVGPVPGDHLFEASEPIQVTQYVPGGASPGAGSIGDPAMCNLISPDHFNIVNRFSTFLGGGWSIPSLTQHHLLVFARDTDTATITLNSIPIGAGSFSPIIGSGFSVARVPIPAGTYITQSANGHGVLVLGYANGPDSYFLPAGSGEMVAVSPCLPDGLDGGPCCTPAQPNVPFPGSFKQDSLQICWRDCDVETVLGCSARWTLAAANFAPCTVTRMSLELRDASGTVKWRGRFFVQYSRTWQEADAITDPRQVWRFLVNGDLRPTAAAGPIPCPVPPCAPVHGNRVRFTGYIDMARSCAPSTTPPPGPEFSWMLTHACDGIDHQPGFPRGGSFHPDRTYSFVGPAAGFVPTPLLPVASGASSVEAVRRVDFSAGIPICTYEEQADFSITPLVEDCRCGLPSAQPQVVVSDLALAGACGTSISSGGPFLPGYVSMAIGSWTSPGTYPGTERLRWSAGGYLFDDCFGIVRDDLMFGVTTLGGTDAFTIPSTPGAPSLPLPPIFIDQCNALGAGSSTPNVVWKRSDHFLNLNLP